MADPKMREFMSLSIDDPSFQLLRIQFDAAIENIIKQMDERDVDDGTITIKVKIGKEKAILLILIASIPRPGKEATNFVPIIDQRPPLAL